MLTDAEGEPTVFIEVVQDVTKLEQLAKQHMEAESISQAKSSFLAMVSHEIRTPMNAILGITEMQLQTGTLSPETADAFGRIYAAGYTLLGIMNDILDLSRIEAGKVELMPAQYSVASLLSDTVQLNVVRIGSKPIAFRLHVDEELPSELFGDELRIKQILSNLLSNAIKYTDAGEVALSAAAEYGRNAEEPDVTLVCRVSDTGQGMTPEQVGRLFDEYSRFSPEANRAIEGIGLGMSITRQLVHMMDGTISVESTPRRGSIFTVRLPQERIGAGSLGREVAEGLRQLKFNLTPYMKMTHIVRDPMPYGSVLIVDDLDTNVYVTRGLLAPYGLSIDSAASGLEALAKIRSGKEYDIVFMDHMMPQMDGIETARLMRELGYNRPIIALTANAVVGQSEMFLDSGFSNYLSKPVDLRRLDMLLNRLIRDRQPPEVIAAARRQNVRPQGGNTAPAFVVDPQLARLFAQEAARAVATLEEVSANQYRGDDDIQQFIINVHSMKSALAHIGEARLAAVAGTLEQAGRKRDTFVMSAEIPSFLDALRAVIDTIRPQEEDEADGAVDEDRAYLREKLLAIQAACAAYDRKAAKGALAELRQKPWSRLTREQINTIAAHLLHSDFEEAAGVAEKTLRETG
jgi:CheY-like chemotaxis protein/nitrogen-specific signal transduction histidine kinase